MVIRYQMEELESMWSKCLTDIGIESAALLAQSPCDPARGTYLFGEYVYKIVLIEYDTTQHLRRQDLFGEFEILKHCKSIPGIPSPIKYYRKDQFAVLILEHIHGKNLANLRVGWFNLLIILAKLGIIIFKIAKRGVSHNDILEENVIVSSSGRVYLIDFDQASRSGFFAALIRSFFGINVGGGKMYGSLIGIVENRLKRVLPPRVTRFIGRIIKYRHITPLPKLPDNASNEVQTLLKAWKIARKSSASSPGMEIAYYSIDVDGYHFPGERPWINRWDTLHGITNYSGKKVLELGCNMGLLSCFLLKYANVKESLAVDSDENILEAAKLIATVLKVNPKFDRVDFDNPGDWESKLMEFKPDIVFALNILNWINNKKRFLSFLCLFNELIFEGHDGIEIETKRLRDIGFRKIELIAYSDRDRPIFYCKK